MNMLKIGDHVLALVDYHLFWGEVVGLGPKNVRIKLPPQCGLEAHVRKSPREKVVHAYSEPFSVVRDTTVGRNGRGSYRIERGELYADRHRAGWRSTSDYVVEYSVQGQKQVR